jgi:hypothetical protein
MPGDRFRAPDRRPEHRPTGNPGAVTPPLHPRNPPRPLEDLIKPATARPRTHPNDPLLYRLSDSATRRRRSETPSTRPDHWSTRRTRHHTTAQACGGQGPDDPAAIGSPKNKAKGTNQARPEDPS